MKMPLTVTLSGVGAGMAVALALGAGTAHADDDPTPPTPPDLPVAWPLNLVEPAGDQAFYGLTSLEDAFAGTISGYHALTIDQLFDSNILDGFFMDLDRVLPIGLDQFLKDLSLGMWAGQETVPAYVDLPAGQTGVIGSAGDVLLNFVEHTFLDGGSLAQMIDGGSIPALTNDTFDPGLALSATVVDIGDLLGLIGPIDLLGNV